MATKNATAPKKESKGFTGIKSGMSVIIACACIAFAMFFFGAGHVSNFVGAPEGVTFAFQAEGTLESSNLIGTVYHGGIVVPVIWTLFVTVFALAIERFFAIRNAYGRTNLTKFVADIKKALAANDLVAAQKICDAQRGSVAAVVSATLKTYKEMEEDTRLTKEQKIIAIQKQLEEATALEMPTMQENLPIIGSIVSLGTLAGLFGTVLGMIVSFQAGIQLVKNAQETARSVTLNLLQDPWRGGPDKRKGSLKDHSMALAAPWQVRDGQGRCLALGLTKDGSQTSLVVQWRRIHLPMPGTQVRPPGLARSHMPRGS